IDGETLVRTLMAYKRGEPRVCSMARAPTPQEEDRRRVCRERRTLVGERVTHVNRIKGLLFAQGVFGYEPLRKGRGVGGCCDSRGAIGTRPSSTRTTIRRDRPSLGE